MIARICCVLILGAAILGTPSVLAATVLYTSDFTSGAGWTVNLPTFGPGVATNPYQEATFGFDYSAFGIPAAPGSADTVGLRLRANIPGGPAAPVTTSPLQLRSGLSVSPTGKNFGVNYKAEFYVWSNFNGSPNAQGIGDGHLSEGGSNNIVMAIGTSGTVPLTIGTPWAQMDGIGFTATNDGISVTADYAVYPKIPFASFNSAYYAAGGTDSSLPYYQSLFGSHAAPAIQQALATAEYPGDAFNTQAGMTEPGAFGFAWRKVVLTKLNGIVTWDVDDTRIATYDASALTLGGANIGLGLVDPYDYATRHPSLLFTVFDNLTVTGIPEPSSALLLLMGLVGVLARR